MFTANSNKKVWWKCIKGHEWEAIIANRNKGKKCPYCSNQKLLKGYNDLETKNPILSKYWNYKKNNDLKPYDFFPNSHIKVWWKCPDCGKEWKAKISDMNRKENKCSICSKNKK